jgi:putative DNA primase/helicase
MDGTNGLDRFADRNNAIPQELKELKQWVTWWPTVDKSGKPGKGFSDKNNDPSTWRTFDQVKDWQNIAFVIGDRGEFVGVDLDDCIVDGKYTERASEILQAFAHVSYAEISPSGNGVKLLIRGQKPDWAVCQAGTWLECYDNRRFWCLTGQVIRPDWATIGDDEGQVEWLCSNWLRKPENSPPERTEPASRGSHTMRTQEEQDRLFDRGCAYADNIPPAQPGNRDNNLFKMAGHLISLVGANGERLTDRDLYAILAEYDGACPEPLGDAVVRQKIRSARQSPTPRELKPAKTIDSRSRGQAGSIAWSPDGNSDGQEIAEQEGELVASVGVADWVQPYVQEPSERQKANQRTSGGKISRTVILDDIPIEAALDVPYILEDLWPMGMPMLVSGVQKSEKTTLCIMMSFDILTGGKFLDRFQVGQKPNTDPDDPSDGWRVLFLTCETGIGSVRKRFEYMKDNLVQRMIHDGRIPEYDMQNGDLWSNLRTLQKRMEMRDHLENHIGKMLKRLAISDDPQLITREFIDSPSQQERLRALIARNQSNVVIIDPEYLQFDAERADAGKSGILYSAVTHACAQEGATLAIVAHNKTPTSDNPQRDFVTLRDVAFSGLRQFARAWFLVARESEFNPYEGKHRLLLTTGNSDGGADRLYVELHETKTSLRLARVLTEPEWNEEKDQRKQERAKERELEVDAKRLARFPVLCQIIEADPRIARKKILDRYNADRSVGIGDDTLQSDLDELLADGRIQVITKGKREFYAPAGWIDPESVDGTEEPEAEQPPKPSRRRSK